MLSILGMLQHPEGLHVGLWLHLADRGSQPAGLGVEAEDASYELGLHLRFTVHSSPWDR